MQVEIKIAISVSVEEMEEAYELARDIVEEAGLYGDATIIDVVKE